MYCINVNCLNPAIETDGLTNCPSCGEGLLLHNRYYANALLGQGGFGRTYRAIDTHNPQGKICVIKQFIFQSTSSSTNKTAINLFYQEAKHLESLGDHPQIPNLIDYFDEAGQHYLVQEYIDGENLEQELLIEGSFDQGEIREILESMLPVLDWLHHRSIPVIHRDIKPANIIRRWSDGKLVLVDFGAAKLAGETLLAKTGTSIGSAEYAAPEQVRGKPTFASDVYSLGVTCIHLLTSIPPFDLYSVAENDWDWHNSLGNNRVDQGLRKVIDKMIDPALSRRYRTALEALSGLQNSQEIVIPKDIETFGVEIEGTFDQHKILAIESLNKAWKGLMSSLPIMNFIALTGANIIAVLTGPFPLKPFQDIALKDFPAIISGLPFEILIVFGFPYFVVIILCYFKARESFQIGNWIGMQMSIVFPWLVFFFFRELATFISKLD
jgi:serine/threonine protein kinase